MADLKVWQLWRYTFALFPYWIGFSWRKVGGMGRVVDLGFFKLVRARSSTAARPK